MLWHPKKAFRQPQVVWITFLRLLPYMQHRQIPVSQADLFGSKTASQGTKMLLYHEEPTSVQVCECCCSTNSDGSVQPRRRCDTRHRRGRRESVYLTSEPDLQRFYEERSQKPRRNLMLQKHLLICNNKITSSF